MGCVDEYDDRVATYAHQPGPSSVQPLAPNLLRGEAGSWGLDELRERCDAHGLAIDGLANVPIAHFWKIQRGLPCRDEQIENYCGTIRNTTAVGIDTIGYNFPAKFVWRTDMAAPGRGGSKVTAFNLLDAHRENALAGYRLTSDEPVEEPITSEQMWDNHQYFLDAVLPGADEVGVRLALHPDDPPVDEPLGGMARIFTSPAARTRARDQARHSPSWGPNFWLGTIPELNGEQVIDLIGESIAYVHFRDVTGTASACRECFLEKASSTPLECCAAWPTPAFDGFIIDDHVSSVIGDTATWGDTSPEAYCSPGGAHAIGYLQGVLNALGLDSPARPS